VVLLLVEAVGVIVAPAERVAAVLPDPIVFIRLSKPAWNHKREKNNYFNAEALAEVSQSTLTKKTSM